jgi:2-iminobutanoate/2-iminopropanoate deaminase
MMKAINADDAPRAIGPYSQAIRAGDTVYCSGQIAIDPATGEVNTGGAAEQTGVVLRNLAAVLAAADASLRDVVKTTVFLSDMDDFGQMNAVYEDVFGSHKPARAAVQVARLPRDVRVEIDCIAVVEARRELRAQPKRSEVGGAS